jgi:hypothetical protein
MATLPASDTRRSPHVWRVPSGAGRTARLRRIAIVLLAVLLAAPTAGAQEPDAPRLLLSGIQTGGTRNTVTEGWSKIDFIVTNRTDSDRKVRVFAFYENRKDIQYGRELWVPAQAAITSWLPVGPAPAQTAELARELQLLLYDVTDGKEELILPPTKERVRGQGLTYRKREPDTALVIDVDDDAPVLGQLPVPESPGDEAYKLVRAFRSSRKLSSHVHVVRADTLPPWSRAIDGIDELVLASPRVTDDPAGMRALRHWVEQGGQLWVTLDRVEPTALVPLLGDALDFTVVGREGLTDFPIEDPGAIAGTADGPMQHHERPVEFVRVLLPPGETVHHTVNGWPAWFSRSVGRGKILFTTLGPRGWYQPGSAHEPSDALVIATETLRVRSTEPPPDLAFESLLTEEIGYAIVGRGTVLLIFGVFAAGVLALAMLGLWSRKRTWLGWAAPSAALLIAGAFLVLGEMARRAAPPTVAYAQVLNAVAGTDEIAVHGVLAVYRPDSGPVELGAAHGGFLDLDLSGTEGQTRRLIMTDLGAWHWENLALPAGVRFAPFEFTARSETPLDAVARFGPDGVQGTVAAKGIENLADGLVTGTAARDVAIVFGPGKGFSTTSADALPAGQFLAGTLLSDQQQQRQEIYRRMLKRSAAGASSSRPTLMAWSDPLAMPFRLPQEARLAGTALLSVPLRFARSEPGTRVTVPGAFVPVRRVLDTGKIARPVLESTQQADQHLRFQLPSAVRPLQIERARLVAKIDARARRVTVAGHADSAMVELHHEENPLGPIYVEIADARLLNLDDDGGLHVSLQISNVLREAAATDGPPKWTIEYLELEVRGTTQARDTKAVGR